MNNGRFKSDEFALSVTKVAVSQICLGVGLDGSKESALDAFTDIAIGYLRDLSRASSFYAVLSGRSECNFFDIVRGLEDVTLPNGFLGGSKCLTSSAVLTEVIRFLDCNEEAPFSQPLTKFPIVRDSDLIHIRGKTGDDLPAKHVPPWLPAFPDPHTYLHTPVWGKRSSDPREEKLEQSRQRRKAERALLNLQQRLVGDASKNKGARDVSVPENRTSDVIPLETGIGQVSVMDAFAPTLEAVKEVELSGDDNIEREVLPEKRSTVNFRIKIGKKLLWDSLNVKFPIKNAERKKSWLGRDDERDEKKRRSEIILRQSMENPQELTQL